MGVKNFINYLPFKFIGVVQLKNNGTSLRRLPEIAYLSKYKRVCSYLNKQKNAG